MKKQLKYLIPIGAALVLLCFGIVGLWHMTTDPTSSPPDSAEPPEHIHAWSDWETDIRSTCSKEGTKNRKCSCGATETMPIPKREHEEGEWTTLVEHTPLSAGTIGRTCVRCGTAITTKETPPASSGLGYRLLPDDTYQVISLGTCTDTDVIIPSTYLDKPVTSIGERILDANAIRQPPTSITIGEGITEISDNAFQNALRLKTVVLPNSLTKIGNSVFLGCSALTKITLSDSLTEIGTEAFRGCSSLTEIAFPDSLTKIGDYAFCGCTSLAELHLPDSITEISNAVFLDCRSLSEITFPASLTKISDDAFRYCDSLTEITLPDSLTEIGTSAFSSCSSLSEITLPASLTKLGDEAFRGCISLTEITLPAPLTEIGNMVFGDAKALEQIHVAEGNPVYHSTGGCLIETASRTVVIALSDTAIPQDGSATIIGYQAFATQADLTEITIPEGIVEIADRAFEGYSCLRSATLPSTLKRIGTCAFAGCDITEIVFPTSLTHLGTQILSNGRFIHVLYDGSVEQFRAIELTPIQKDGVTYTETFPPLTIVVHCTDGNLVPDQDYLFDPDWRHPLCSFRPGIPPEEITGEV